MWLLEWLDAATAVARKIETIAPSLGYLAVSILGGAAAYVKEWEDKYPNRTKREHACALFRRLLFALISGILWYQIVAWQGMLGSPLSYIGATLVGLYSAEFLDWLWAMMKSRMGAKVDPK